MNAATFTAALMLLCSFAVRTECDKMKRAEQELSLQSALTTNPATKEQGIMADSQLTRECTSTEEVFKEIPGFPGYEVSTFGNVRSYWVRGANIIGIAPKLLKRARSSNGYLTVNLGAGNVRAVHSLVLTTFVGPRPDGMEACHNNGVRSDARLENLRWDTHKNNCDDRKRHGTQAGVPPVLSWSRNGNAVLSEAAVLKIKQRLVAGERCRAIAAAFGVHESAISQIRRGKLWKHVAPELNALFPVRHRVISDEAWAEAKRLGISKRTLQYRIANGFTLEQALNPKRVKGYSGQIARDMLSRKEQA